MYYGRNLLQPIGVFGDRWWKRLRYRYCLPYPPAASPCHARKRHWHSHSRRPLVRPPFARGAAYAPRLSLELHPPKNKNAGGIHLTGTVLALLSKRKWLGKFLRMTFAKNAKESPCHLRKKTKIVRLKKIENGERKDE